MITKDGETISEGDFLARAFFPDVEPEARVDVRALDPFEDVRDDHVLALEDRYLALHAAERWFPGKPPGDDFLEAEQRLTELAAARGLDAPAYLEALRRARK